MQNKEITLFVMYKGLNALDMKEILTKNLLIWILQKMIQNFFIHF